MSSPPSGQATGIFIELLNFLGKSGMVELSLPLRSTFVYDSSWATLQMPRLERLELACQKSPEMTDVFNQVRLVSLQCRGPPC